jgi:hypothetical protein
MSHIASRACDTKHEIISACAKKGKVFLENCRFIAVSAVISPTLAPLQAGFWILFWWFFGGFRFLRLFLESGRLCLLFCWDLFSGRRVRLVFLRRGGPLYNFAI